MKKTLFTNISQATINTNGAYVDTFEVDDKAIFFPKVMVKIDNKLKIRGGMHACAPNFGADKKFGILDQHGFARDLEWEGIESSDSSIRLGLTGIKEYEGVDFVITYELKGSSFFASLRVKNNSSKDQPIAPGFHPYFYSDHNPVVINDIDIDIEKLPSSIYSKEKSQSFIANDNNIEVIGLSNVNEFVIWTDFKGDYICVEPTYSGNSFDDGRKDYYLLKENEDFIQEIEIKVNL